jgi:hypothetical protein
VKASETPVLSSYDILAAPISFGVGPQGNRKVQVIKSGASHSAGDSTFIVRNIAYSVGQRDRIQGQRSVSFQEFLYAWDSSADPLLPRGLEPADLRSQGCRLQQLASTRGQGHQFALFKVECGARPSSPN